MKCSELQEYLSLYYDDLLGDDDKILVETHLNTCPTCMKDYEAFKNALTALASLEDIKAPRELENEVNARIDRLKRKNSFWEGIFSSRILVVAPQVVSVALFVVMGVLVYNMYGMFTKLNRNNMNPVDRTGRISMNQTSMDDYSPPAREKLAEGESARSKTGLGFGGYSLNERKSQDLNLPSKRIAAKSVGVRAKDNIEIVPCSNASEDMDDEIERLVMRSNGNIVRLKRGPQAKKELLIRIPLNSYPYFMGRLKRVVDEKRNLEEGAKEKGIKTSSPLMLRSMKKMSPMEEPAKSEKPEEFDKAEVDDNGETPQIKLIKVVYE